MIVALLPVDGDSDVILPRSRRGNHTVDICEIMGGRKARAGLRKKFEGVFFGPIVEVIKAG